MHWITRLASAGVFSVCCFTAAAQTIELPPSSILSNQAKQVIKTAPVTEGPGAPPLPKAASMADTRHLLDERLAPNLQHMRDLYPVDIEDTVIDGVAVSIVTPHGGVPAENKNRVMINAHGGGFFMGTRTNGLLVAIPIASVGRMRVISVLYRQAPEYHYPAATDDFTTVYRHVLKSYKAARIGLVGCSAGGTLVAESAAAFQKLGLPTPGVMGIYCSGANPNWMQGDSASYFKLTSPPMNLPGGGGPVGSAYFGDRNRGDAAISPDVDLAVMAKFPPTLWVSATRDMAMSQAAYSHRRLLLAGVQSELLIYDGLAHAFMTNPDLPESRELYQLATTFYDAHLGR